MSPDPVTVPPRVLVRAPNWIGDAVLSLPALRDLRRAAPSAHLTVLARPSVAPLYGVVAEVDAVRTTTGFRADARALAGAFDAGLLLPNSFGSALQLWMGKVPERWGYATDARRPLLTRAVRVPAAVRGTSEVYYYRAMLAGLGIAVDAPADASLACPEDARAFARGRLPGERWIGLNPGAAFGSAKRWIPARYAAAGELLARRLDASVVVVGGPGERAVAAEIASTMSVPVVNLAGETTLVELLGVLARLRLLLTNDSGPMHLASSLGVPVVAVFGPTDWRETAPLGRHALVRRPVYCSPCKLRACPIDHRCMRGVTVDAVVEAAEELLAS